MNIEDKFCWTLQQVHTFIKMVRDRPVLYDKKHREYKSKTKKETAWEDIASILQSHSAFECKRKWNTLRIQQRRIISKGKNGTNRNIQWHCFELLQFLIPHMEWNIAGDDLQKGEFSECEDEQLFDNANLISYSSTDGCTPTINENQLNLPDSLTHLKQQNISNLTSDSNQTFESNEEIPSSSHCNKCTESSLSEPLKTKVDVSNDANNSNKVMNYFLMDIQLQMEKLNDLAQLELKIEIQKLLLQKLRCPENLRKH